MMAAAEILLFMLPGLSTGWFWGFALSIGMDLAMRWSTATGRARYSTTVPITRVGRHQLRSRSFYTSS
jgi:hypothetical protein